VSKLRLETLFSALSLWAFLRRVAAHDPLPELAAEAIGGTDPKQRQGSGSRRDVVIGNIASPVSISRGSDGWIRKSWNRRTD
jgi:hypothetical protein